MHTPLNVNVCYIDKASNIAAQEKMRHIRYMTLGFGQGKELHNIFGVE